MMRQNDVFQVLVTKGNAVPLAAGSPVTSLAPGQIGVFDANTRLSVNGSGKSREIFIAVGVDRDADTVTDDILLNAGGQIQTAGIQVYNFRPHTAPQPMIVDLTNVLATCGKDYTIKYEFRNDKIYRTQGFVQFTKSYTVPADECACDGDCAAFDGNVLVSKLKTAINADTPNLVVASIITPIALTTATHGVAANLAIGAVVSDADMIAVTAYFKTVNTDASRTNDVVMTLRTTTVPLALNNFFTVNQKYFYPRETTIITTLKDGFENTGTVTTIQNAAYEEGSHYDLKQKEYKALGYKGSVYKSSAINGLAFDENFEYFAETGVKYDQFALTYKNTAPSGSRMYDNTLDTIIAIPIGDKTNTTLGLVAILDGLFGPFGFDTLVSDVTASNQTATVVETTTSKGVTNDGIG